MDDELINALEKLLSVLESSGTFLKTFIDSDGTAGVYVSWFSSNRSGGTTIRFELLRRFADLRVDLSLDVYGADSAKAALPVASRTSQAE